MKKLLYTFIIGLLCLPSFAFATPVSWDFNANVLQVLNSMRDREVRVPWITATTTRNNTLPNLTSTNSTTTAATTTNQFVTNYNGTNGTSTTWYASFLQGLTSIFGNATTTNATTTNLTASGQVNFSALSTGCLQSTSGIITSSGVACGTGSGGGFGESWRIFTGGAGSSNFLAPTTTLGIVLNASSSLSALDTRNATVTNATSTNSVISRLNVNSEVFTDLTGTGLLNTANVLTLDNTGAWTGTFDGFEGSTLLTHQPFGRDWGITVGGAGSTNFLTPTTTLGIVLNASSSLFSLDSRNATATNATTTNLRVSNGFSFGGVIGTAWSDFCTAITGGAGLCDGVDDSGGGGGGAGNWATTTDRNPSILETVNYTNADVYIGGTASNTSEFNFDIEGAKLTLSSTTATQGFISIGTSSQRANLTVDGTGYFQSGIIAASSSVVSGTTTNATSSFLVVSGQTTLGTLTGLLKGTSGIVSVATAGVDYLTGMLFGKDWALTTGGAGSTNYLTPTSTLGIVLNASSSISALNTRNATITNATSTNLVASGSVNLFGSTPKTTANALCIQLTGDAGLCDGNDATGGAGGALPDWVKNALLTAITPTTTVGIIINASSSITVLDVQSGTTTNATSTNLTATRATSTTFGSTFLTATNATTTFLKINAIHDSASSLGTNGMVLQTSGSANTWVATSSLGSFFSLNGLGAVSQTFATSSAGAGGWGFGSVGSVHTLTIPNAASTTNHGLLTGAGYKEFAEKVSTTSIDTSAELLALLTDETGTGNAVFSASPTFTGTAIFNALTANASSSITNLSVISGTTTHSTSTNQNIGGQLTFNGVSGSTWASFCTAITGGAGLCDGTDDTGGAGGASPDWVKNSLLTAISPTTTVGIIVNASSTFIGGVTIDNATTTNATSTNSVISRLNINSEVLTDLTGTGLQNTAGALTLNATGDWTGTLDGFEGSTLLTHQPFGNTWNLTVGGAGTLNFLTPTSTLGIVLNASSSISSLDTRNATTTNATSTNLAATTICLTADTCRTTWPTGSGGTPDFTFESNFGTTTAATTTPLWGKNGVNASSTSNFATSSVWQSLVLNNNIFRLRDVSDGFHYIVYDSTADGPKIAGYEGGILAHRNGTVATWNTNGFGVGSTSPISKLSVGTNGNGSFWAGNSTTTSATTTNLAVTGAVAFSAMATGCLQSTAGVITSTGSACGGGSSFPFASDNTYNQVVFSTSTPTLWFKSGLFASSTSYMSKLSIVDRYGSQNQLFSIATTSSNAGATSSLFTVNADGRVGIASSTPSATLGINGNMWITGTTTGTSTLYINSNAGSKGGRIILEDVTGTACTEVTATAGVLTAKVVTCP